jgi:hypothetical protein
MLRILSYFSRQDSGGNMQCTRTLSVPVRGFSNPGLRVHGHIAEEDPMTQTEPARAATRLAGGTELPAPGRWQIDPGHTELAFIGRHFMLTKVRGRFRRVRSDPGGRGAW